MVGRDDVDCVIHTHSKAGVAVAAMKDGLLPLSQHAQLFFGRVSYHDYEGLAIDIDERQRLVRDLGSNPVMILRNHGLLAVGTSIPLAFSNLFNLQFACETQVLAMAGNAALNLPSAAGRDNARVRNERRNEPGSHPPACAFSRVAVSDIVGVSASASTLRCRIAGLPDFCAASNAGQKSAVFSTVAP
jgi:ribulose-5-phosphate 4-epimerase/fuculose-1-phosphate aldolase